MPTGQTNRLARFLRRTAGPGDGLSDGQLLARFTREHDGDAFAALVRRHGPMVLGICRRVLGNPHDADDAFQAVFLVLARKARSVRSLASLGGWLARVSYRAANRARSGLARLREREQTMSDLPHPTTDPAVPDDLLALLDQEIDRLPEKYRVPVVLCELGGKSRKQAARELGLAEGTLSWRLAKARKLLARRLAHYRSALTVAALAGLLAPASTSASLIRTTTEAALQIAAGNASVTGLASHRVLTLVEGVTKAMFLTRLKVYGVVVVLLVGAGAAGLTARSASAQDTNAPASRPREARWVADALEELRLEVAALRKGLEVTREEVRSLRAESQAQRSRLDNLGPDHPERRAMNRTGAATPGPQQPNAAADRQGYAAEGLVDLANTMLPQNRKVDEERRRVEQAQKEADLRARGFLSGALSHAVPDPVADAEAALKKLKAHPGDKEATEALEKALQRLKQPRKGHDNLQRQ